MVLLEYFWLPIIQICKICECFKKKSLFVFLRFLYDTNSRDYLYYRKRVAEYRKNLPKPIMKPPTGKWIFALLCACVKPCCGL